MPALAVVVESAATAVGVAAVGVVTAALTVGVLLVTVLAFWWSLFALTDLLFVCFFLVAC